MYVYYVVSESQEEFGVDIYYNEKHDSALSITNLSNPFTSLAKAKKYAKSLEKRDKKSNKKRTYRVIPVDDKRL